jgi:leader peptidase (prepilin peptidase)/N-methyltransferase
MLDFLDADTLRVIALAYWLILAFVLGAVIGSFVNVAVARLPLEKSLLWPGSRCGACLQPVRWYDNLPLISYLWLRGRCRTCGSQFSSRYFWIELLTGLGFVAMFHLEVNLNVHHWPGPPRYISMPPWPWLVGFAYHALLFVLLLTASVCDLRTREIPLGLTLTGTALGLIGAVLMPWPWPAALPGIATPAGMAVFRPGAEMAWQQTTADINQGIYAWPFWGPLPGPFAPGGNWQTGLADGLAGALAGSLLMRGVGFLFGSGLGKESLGLGDADLMMMAGAFLGWQVVVVAFFVSVLPGIIMGIFQMIVFRDNSFSFGPSLSIGILASCLGWRWIMAESQLRQIFFNGWIMALLAIAGGGLLFGMAFCWRLVKA